MNIPFTMHEQYDPVAYLIYARLYHNPPPAIRKNMMELMGYISYHSIPQRNVISVTLYSGRTFRVTVEDVK